jgi:TonB family protein
MKKEILLFIIFALVAACVSTYCYGNETATNLENETNEALEGWVRMSFDITESGTTDNIKILDSSPSGKFDSEAVKALSKWKYKPKVVDGIAVRQTDLKVQLDFVLENNEN